MHPKVNIIIINWNNLDDTLTCLEKVYQQDYPRFSVTVIDNGSRINPSTTIQEAFPNTSLICNRENLGYTGGSNQGIQLGIKTGADYIWLLNNDTQIPNNSLSNMVDFAENDNQAGLFSPVIHSSNTTSHNVYLGTYLDLTHRVRQNAISIDQIQKWQVEEPKHVCLWGTALLIKRRLIEKIGLLDPKYFAYYEDMDYSVRSIQSGFFNRIITNVSIQHNVKAPQRKDYPDHYHFYMTRNEYLFWMKYLNKDEQGKFRRAYLHKVLKKSGTYHKQGAQSAAHALLDGAWCALHGKFGPREVSDKMPSVLQQLCLWHPFLLSHFMTTYEK